MSFELRSDVQALRFGEFVTWAKLVVRVSVGPEGKISLGYFHPCGFHFADGSHHIFVVLSAKLCNLQRKQAHSGTVPLRLRDLPPPRLCTVFAFCARRWKIMAQDLMVMIFIA